MSGRLGGRVRFPRLDFRTPYRNESSRDGEWARLGDKRWVLGNTVPASAISLPGPSAVVLAEQKGLWASGGGIRLHASQFADA